MSLTTRKMSDAHEEHLVEVFGGRKTRGSGNQPANPMDGRHSRYERAVAFAWDGKSTRGNSIGVTREMVTKAKEQAHGERPMIALRWYDDDRLRSFEDWVCIQEDDLLELMERSDRLAEIEERVLPVLGSAEQSGAWYLAFLKDLLKGSIR
jgi:hypothetical protein